MYLRSHAQKYIPGVYLHVCKLYTRVNLAHANWTLLNSMQICGKLNHLNSECTFCKNSGKTSSSSFSAFGLNYMYIGFWQISANLGKLITESDQMT